jgi:hypothetical protein
MQASTCGKSFGSEKGAQGNNRHVPLPPEPGQDGGPLLPALQLARLCAQRPALPERCLPGEQEAPLQGAALRMLHDPKGLSGMEVPLPPEEEAR